MRSHTTVFHFDNGTFFAAHTDNGGFRVGMNDLCAIEFPVGHPDRVVAEALTEETIEVFIDLQVDLGRIRF